MNGSIEKWVESVDKRLDNHIKHIVPKVTKIETNQKWLMKFFWAFMTPALAGIVYIIFQLK